MATPILLKASGVDEVRMAAVFLIVEFPGPGRPCVPEELEADAFVICYYFFCVYDSD